MNTVSWLLYAAEVSAHLQALLITMGALSAIACAVAMVIGGVGADCGDWPAGSWKRPLKWAWVPPLCFLAAVPIPGRMTIYMIAASEAGETIVTSPDAVEIMGYLKAVITKELKDELAK